MPAFTTPGSDITQRITFNSGYLDFGSNRIVDLSEISLSIEWQINTLYVLNSIKPQDIVRSQQKVSLSAKIKSFAAEIQQLALGSSQTGTPVEIDTLDGQPTLQNPVLTVYDRNNKEIQYQVSGAIVKMTNIAARMEDYADFELQLEAKDIAILYTP